MGKIIYFPCNQDITEGNLVADLTNEDYLEAVSSEKKWSNPLRYVSMSYCLVTQIKYICIIYAVDTVLALEM